MKGTKAVHDSLCMPHGYANVAYHDNTITESRRLDGWVIRSGTPWRA